MKSTKIITMMTVIVLTYKTGFCQAQNLAISEKTSFSLPLNGNLINYIIYPVAYRVSGVFKSQGQSLNAYPEEVLISLLSATNHEWNQSNYAYHIKDNKQKYEAVKSKSVKPEIELLRKIEFNSNSTDYAIVKFYLIENGENAPSSYIMIKKKDRWFITDEVELSKIDMMFTYLNTNALDAIFLKRKLSIPTFDKQVDDAHLNGYLNLNIASNSAPSGTMSPVELSKLIESKFLNK